MYSKDREREGKKGGKGAGRKLRKGRNCIQRTGNGKEWRVEREKERKESRIGKGRKGGRKDVRRERSGERGKERRVSRRGGGGERLCGIIFPSKDWIKLDSVAS